MLQVAPVLEGRRLPLTAEQQDALRHDPDLARRVNILRSTVPAITHVDFSARVQTVDERHGRFYRFMKAFHAKTGFPIVVNTSFNLSWEPIVLAPEHAYHTFMQSEMDVLVLEDCVLFKAEQPLGMRPWAAPGRSEPDPEAPWADPLTGEPLVVTAESAHNPATGRRDAVEEGIPRLFMPTEGESNGQDVTEVVKQFYEETPFPNYEDLDNSLRPAGEGPRGAVCPAVERADPLRCTGGRGRLRHRPAHQLPGNRPPERPRRQRLLELAAVGGAVPGRTRDRARPLPR